MWYLRLTHTRLSDSILDICGVPQKDPLRRLCLRLLTQFTAPPPSKLSRFLPIKRKRSNSRYTEHNPKELLLASLESATETHGLPKSAAKSLELFILGGCMPLPLDITEAMERIKMSLLKLRHQSDKGKTADPRRFKRFEDAGKSLKHLVNLVQLLYSIGIGPLFGSKESSNVTPLNRPLYISLDLGLRQRRNHYHGYTLYQCISLKESYFDDVASGDDEFETNETIISSSGPGLKIAEGGRYDDLVRRYRPPGNFGSALLNQYTTAPIPKVREIHRSRTYSDRINSVSHQQNLDDSVLVFASQSVGWFNLSMTALPPRALALARIGLSWIRPNFPSINKAWTYYVLVWVIH
jgi:hypothetical protein